MGTGTTPAKIGLEILIVAGGVVLANVLWGRGDAGWVALNPTPYVLLPLLIGGRYGTLGGLAAALVAGACILLGQFWAAGIPPGQLIAREPFLLLALPLFGVVAGEFNRLFAGRRQHAESLANEQRKEADQLRCDLELAHESQQTLQVQLALRGAEFCSLDIELARLFEASAGPLLPNLLRVLAQTTGITDAAFYRSTGGGEIGLESSMGDPDLFPERLDREAAPAAFAAISSRQLVTARDIWLGDSSSKSPYVAALPFAARGAAPSRVLVIADMPLLATNWETFARIEVACAWVAQREAGASGVPGPAVVGVPEFGRYLTIAAETVSKTGLPSTLLLITAGTGLLGHSDIGEVSDMVAKNVGDMGVLTTLDRDRAKLAVLLPMQGQRDAGRLQLALERVLVCDGQDPVRYQMYAIASRKDADAVWKEISDEQ